MNKANLINNERFQLLALAINTNAQLEKDNNAEDQALADNSYFTITINGYEHRLLVGGPQTDALLTLCNAISDENGYVHYDDDTDGKQIINSWIDMIDFLDHIDTATYDTVLSRKWPDLPCSPDTIELAYATFNAMLKKHTAMTAAYDKISSYIEFLDHLTGSKYEKIEAFTSQLLLTENDKQDLLNLLVAFETTIKTNDAYNIGFPLQAHINDTTIEQLIAFADKISNAIVLFDK